MFHKLGQFVARHPLLVIATWLIIVLGLRIVAPPWNQVTHDGDSGQLPEGMTSVQAQRRLSEAFPTEKAQSECVVVIAGLMDRLRFDDPRSPQQESDAEAIRDLNGKLRRQFAEHEFVVAYWPPVDEQAKEEEVFAGRLRSPDGWAAAILIKTNQDFSAVALTKFVKELNDSVNEIISKPSFPADRLRVSVTGSAAIGSDILTSAAESLRNTELVTICLVLVILLAVYRAPVLVLIPLLTIGASVVASTDLLAIAARFSQQNSAWFDFKIFTTTRIFIVVILVGAGTDFCLFLFARFRETLRGGVESATAIADSLGNVGHALLGSALTTIVGLGMLFFSDFGKFRNSGPALGVCMLVALLASVTLAPALLRLTGRFVFWPFGMGEVNRQDQSNALNVSGLFGRLWKAVARQIVARPGFVMVATLVVLAPFAWLGANVRTTFDLLSELDPDRSSVRGARMLNRHFPPGEGSPITIVATLPAALDTEKSFSPGVVMLRNMTLYLESQPGVRGVRSFASPLGEPVARFGAFSGTELLTARRKTAAHYLSPVAPWTNRVARFEVIGAFAPFSDESRELLREIRENLAKIASGERFTPPGHELPPSVDSEMSPPDEPGIKDQLPAGISNVMDGPLESIEVAPSDVHPLLDDILDLPEDPPSFSGQANGENQDEEQQPVELTVGWETDWQNAEFAFSGATAASSDLQEVVTSDTSRIKILSALAVLLVLLALLRRPVISVFLILSVIFSFLVTIGATELVFSIAYGQEYLGLDWKAPIFLFVILVAIGEDYNIYLITRVFEEQSRLGPMAGLREAVAKTGGIISSCGIIMAGTFVSMMSGTLRGMLELGFALSLGVLLDTFVVRPILVPAFLALLERFRQRGKLGWTS
ncbi:MAG: MMPL family transporter [Pirellulales bacterium]|nr:MMPL family transporter [Pirellulales bacterium]